MGEAAVFAFPGKFYVEIFHNFVRAGVAHATSDVDLRASTPSWVADFRARIARDARDRQHMIERESFSSNPSAFGPSVHGPSVNGPSVSAPSAISGRIFSLRKQRHARDADPQSVKLTLFRASSGRICGWFIGPLACTGGAFSMPHLAPAEETLAPVAVIRAIEAAEAIGSDVCLIDPDDLWTPVWQP